VRRSRTSHLRSSQFGRVPSWQRASGFGKERSPKKRKFDSLVIHCRGWRGFYLSAATRHQGASTSATRPGPSCFFRCGRAPRSALCLRRFARCGRSGRSSAARGGASRLPRERWARSRAARFTLEHTRHGARDARPSPDLALALARLVGVFGAAAGARLGFAFARRAKRNARAPCLG